MVTIFAVEGPRDVPTSSRKVKTITNGDAREFWEDNPDLAERRGCYVFAIRAGRGFTPYYVGKAKVTFKQEVFAPHKLMHYLRVLAGCGKGAPVLFFVVAPKKKGKPNNSHVGDLEDFLIQTGVAAHPDLVNVKGTKKAAWGIAGVLRGGKGKRSHAATKFRSLMKLGP